MGATCEIARMRLLELLREGGAFAFLAVVLGVIGAGVGVKAALLRRGGNRRAAATLGMVALGLAILTAGAGVGGTVLGKRATDRAIASLDVVKADQLRRKGYEEAQGASLVGFFAALAPLLLGALTAMGRDAGGTSARMAVAVAGLAAGAALSQSRQPLPDATYAFAEADTDAWALASTMDLVGRSSEPWVCPNFEKALARYWQPADPAEWPRKLTRPPPPELAGWKKAAQACATVQVTALAEYVQGLRAPGAPKKPDPRLVELLGPGSTFDPNEVVMHLMQSVLVQDEVNRMKLMAIAEELVPDAPPGPTTPQDGPPAAVREAIATVVYASSSALRACYEAGLAARPKLQGWVLVRMDIAADGTVAAATDFSVPPFPDAHVVTCVLELVKRFKFPAGVGPGTVEYPFDFRPE